MTIVPSYAILAPWQGSERVQCQAMVCRLAAHPRRRSMSLPSSASLAASAMSLEAVTGTQQPAVPPRRTLWRIRTARSWRRGRQRHGRLNLFVPIRAFPLGSCSKPQVSSDETTQTPNLYTMYILLLYVCKPCILTTKDFLLMNKIMV